MSAEPHVCFSLVREVLGPSAWTRDLILGRSMLQGGFCPCFTEGNAELPELCSLQPVGLQLPEGSPSHHPLPIHRLIERLPICSAKANKTSSNFWRLRYPLPRCFWASVFSASEDVMCSINPCLSLCLRKINVAQIYVCSHSWGKMKQWYT